MEAYRGGWIILLTFAVALWLSVIPLPEWAQWGRPAWVAMTLIYWVLALPHRVGVGAGWLAGLCLDILEWSPLGQNAFALAVVAYLVLVLHERLRMFSGIQQAAVIFVLLGVSELLSHWLKTLLGVANPNVMFLMPAFVSALLWPWLSASLRFIRRHYQVS